LAAAVTSTVGEERGGEKEKGWNLGLEFEDLTDVLRNAYDDMYTQFVLINGFKVPSGACTSFIFRFIG
jgi:hypothetical protein